MRLAAALLVAACGCRGDLPGSRTVLVHAFAGDIREPGVRVIAHSPSGVLIDEATSDALGHAEVAIDDDSLISLVFGDTRLSIVTIGTPVTGEVSVYGSADVQPPLVVGELRVDGTPVSGAAQYRIELGCASAYVSTLPATIDITACSLGSDNALDVLVLAGDYDGIVGYSADRVAMVDGAASFSIATWQTDYIFVPVTLDAVMPHLELTLYSDGLPFEAPHDALWQGLIVDAATERATLGGGVFGGTIRQRDMIGPPSAIDFGPQDFLPSIATTAYVAQAEPLTIAWVPSNLGDVVNVLASGTVGHQPFYWRTFLPPDASSVTLPETLGSGGVAGSEVDVRYLDYDARDGFAAFLAGGVSTKDAGDLRITFVRGVR